MLLGLLGRPRSGVDLRGRRSGTRHRPAPNELGGRVAGRRWVEGWGGAAGWGGGGRGCRAWGAGWAAGAGAGRGCRVGRRQTRVPGWDAGQVDEAFGESQGDGREGAPCRRPRRGTPASSAPGGACASVVPLTSGHTPTPNPRDTGPCARAEPCARTEPLSACAVRARERGHARERRPCTRARELRLCVRAEPCARAKPCARAEPCARPKPRACARPAAVSSPGAGGSAPPWPRTSPCCRSSTGRRRRPRSRAAWRCRRPTGCRWSGW